MKASQKSLKKWTKEKWGTKSGKPSAKTGERYLPKKAREAFSFKLSVKEKRSYKF